MKEMPQNELPLGSQPVTIHDIARRCNVHYVTVSRALCGDARVKPATAERILAVAREMRYDFSSGYAGRRLVALRHCTKVINHIIGIFFPKHIVRNPYFAEMFEGIMTVTANSGYTLHVIPTIDPEDPSDALSSLPTSLQRGDLDGIIFTHWSSQTNQILQQLRDEPHFSNRPITVLMTELDGCSSVQTDDYQGMTALMRHLLELGHRHFMHSYVIASATDPNTLRNLAMRDTCFAYGLDPDRCLLYESLDWSQTLHYHMELPVQNTLKMHPEVTAIIAPNDFYAAQAYDILQRNGVRIPEDMSLVGFDDIVPIPGKDGNILTTVHLPLEQVGREAAKHLIATIEGKCDELRQIVLPSGPVVVRNTTGPAPIR